MTPVVLAIALSFVAAVGVVVLAAVVTGTRLPGPRDLMASFRAAVGRPREVFTTDDDLADDEVGHVEDVFVVGRPTDPDEEGLGRVLSRVGTHER